MTRRNNAKVKTGCRTCKIRRIKCDEQKPSCLKCTSTGRNCDGYAIATEPFQIQIWSLSQASCPARGVSELAGFGDSVQYLEFFHRCAGPALASRFDNEFWSRTSLQMAYAEPAVRHALIALSYLHKTEPGNIKHARSGFATNSENRTLLLHYNKSVRYLVERMTEQSYTPEIGLVTCVLFICMEFFRGNYHTAFTHLTNGLKVLQEWQKRGRNDSIVSSPLQQSHCLPCNQSALITNQLRPIFIRGIASAMMYGVEVEETFDIPCPILQSPNDQPFTTIQEAQSSYHEIRNASILCMRNLNKKLLQRTALSPEDFQQQAHLLQCHGSWHQSLQLLEKKMVLSKKDRVAISSLKVFYHATSIFIACVHDVSQLVSDTHLNGFKALNREARFVLNSLSPTSPGTAKFTFEIALIPSLYFCATRCRCPVTRREAVSLLELNPPREGLWDAEQHVIVSNRVIEIEEKELDPLTGWPAASTRLWSSVIDANMDRNGGFWAYFLPAKWIGDVDAKGVQKQLLEWIVM